VIYPGSIERVDFGEVEDDKYFIIADIQRGKTEVEWRKLSDIRPFVDCFMRLETQENMTERLLSAMPPAEKLEGAIVRLILEYPRDWESLIDEAALREHAGSAFEFHLVKRPQTEARVRLPGDQAVGSLGPMELPDIYWRANHIGEEDQIKLNKLAKQILRNVQEGF
jgi:exonuclease SbcD